jgi:hypothetical protein
MESDPNCGYLWRCVYRFMRLQLDVASCNLSCFMCSVRKRTSVGTMDLDLFFRIRDKISTDGINIDSVIVGNLGEPTVNKELSTILACIWETWQPPEFSLNTNLTNKVPCINLLLSKIKAINGSISGMSQDVYSRNHKGGQVQNVLDNFVALTETKAKLRSQCIIQMIWHCYKYNVHEYSLAEKFCSDHSIKFTPIRPRIVDMEDAQKFYADQKVQDSFAEYIDIDEEKRCARIMGPGETCVLSHDIVVDFGGKVYKCCGDKISCLGNIFDWNINELVKLNPPICDICRKTPLTWR